MISNKPYMIRAMYDWIVDNGWTPHLQVDASYPKVNVPMEYVQDDVIVLNTAPSAVVGLSMDNGWFTFKARFNGIETTLGFPPEAVLAIFARENGQGMPFPPEPYPEEFLDGKDEFRAESTKLAAVESKKDGADDSASSDKPSPKSKAKSAAKSSDKKKPTLTVVK